MQFFNTLLVGATAIISLVAAQSNTLFFTGVPTSVEAGRTYTITYTAPNPDDPVTITLREGNSRDLTTVATLTSSATGGSYQWTVSDSYYNSAEYALQITQGDQINYTGQFALSGGNGEEPSTSSVVQSSAVSTPSATPSSTPSSTPVSSSAEHTTVHSSTPITTPTSTPGSNTTAIITSMRPTGTTGTGPAPTTAGNPAPTGAASGLKSPIALVLGAVAALAYLH